MTLKCFLLIFSVYESGLLFGKLVQLYKKRRLAGFVIEFYNVMTPHK